MLTIRGHRCAKNTEPQMPIFIFCECIILTTTSCYINKLRWLTAHFKMLQGEGFAKLLNYKYNSQCKINCIIGFLNKSKNWSWCFYFRMMRGKRRGSKTETYCLDLGGITGEHLDRRRQLKVETQSLSFTSACYWWWSPLIHHRCQRPWPAWLILYQRRFVCQSSLLSHFNLNSFL